MIERAPLHVLDGTTWQFVAECRTADGDPYPFTGLAAKMQLRATLGAAPFADLVDGAGLTFDEPNAGDIAVEVRSDWTRGLCRGGRQVEILTEILVSNADDPPLVVALVPLRITVWPAGTRLD